MSQDIANKYPSHAIIFDYLVSKRTGTLIFEPGNRKLYFDSGQLVFASSEKQGEHFADILVASGILSTDQLDQAKAAAKPGKSLGHQLKALGFATSQQLAHALKQQITYIVDHAIAQIDGDCHSQEGSLPSKLPKLKIQSLGLIIKSIFKMESDIFTFQVQLDQALFKTAVGDLHLSKIAIPPSYLELFNFLRENVMFSPGTLQEIAKLDGPQLKKMIYILHQLGIIAFKDEVAAIQEPLADLTNDEDTFQDDTMGEDALATVLPPTSPPKTDPQGHLDPQRAARAINLPNFTQSHQPKDGTPTLRVQDPRAGVPMELDETVRQFDSSARRSKPVEFQLNDAFDDESDGFERDLSTISKELDPQELEPLPDSIEDNVDDLPSLQAQQELLFSEDNPEDETEGDAETSFSESESYDQPLLDSFDPLADFSANADDTGKQDLVLEPSNSPQANYFDTEPALPVKDLRDSITGATSTAPSSSTEPEDDFLSTPVGTETTKRIIMPEQDDDAFAFEGNTATKRRSAVKLILVVLLVGVLSLVGFRLYQNYQVASLTEEYIGSENDLPQLSENTNANTGDSDPATQDPIIDIDSEANPLDETAKPEESGSGTESGTTTTDLEDDKPESQIEEMASSNSEQPAQKESTSDQSTDSFMNEELPPPEPTSGGRFSEALSESRTRFQASQGSHSLVIMVACQEETVVEALLKFRDQDVYLFPREVNGSPCWMLTWGAFGSYREASGQRGNFPPTLRQGNDPIWVVRPMR